MEKVKLRFPDAEYHLDHTDGFIWFLDIIKDKNHVSVEWREGRPFAFIANREILYGEGPDELCEGVLNTAIRIIHLLESGEST